MRVVSFCSISKARRREGGNLASSRLRPQTSRQDCLRHVLPSYSSAIQQAWIELVISRRPNADAFEIPVFRIEEEICVGGTNRTR
jgi:hypothetical protein